MWVFPYDLYRKLHEMVWADELTKMINPKVRRNEPKEEKLGKGDMLVADQLWMVKWEGIYKKKKTEARNNFEAKNYLLCGDMAKGYADTCVQTLHV